MPPSLAELGEQLNEALSGAKPRYGQVKGSFASIAELDSSLVNPKQISAHNQVSPRSSESSLNRIRRGHPSEWVFVGLVTATGDERDRCIESLSNEVTRFSTVAVLLARDPDWCAKRVLAARGHEETAGKLATFFGVPEGEIAWFDDTFARGEEAAPAADPPVPADLFVTDDDFAEMLELLRRKKNIILQGPPGVGKNFLAERLAATAAGDENRVHPFQFHQSYGYEDFVLGWRPSGTGFELAAGHFLTLCRRLSEEDGNDPHVVVIDEMNRGDLSKILGELMSLLEADKRGPPHALPLMYRAPGEEEQLFYVPENLLVIGLMNTADRSLALVDYALRRRFGFVDVKPAFGTELFENYLLDVGVEPSVVDLITERLTALNTEISSDRRNLGEGFEIGHSFFCPSETGSYGREWYDSVVLTEIAPLLKEYWFDDPDGAKARIEALLQ